MKKYISFLFIFVIILSLSGCVVTKSTVNCAAKFISDSFNIDRDLSPEENRKALLEKLSYTSDWKSNYGDKEVQELLNSRKLGKKIIDSFQKEYEDAKEEYEEEYKDSSSLSEIELLNIKVEGLENIVHYLEALGAENETVKNEFQRNLNEAIPTEEESKKDIDNIEDYVKLISELNRDSYYYCDLPASLIDYICYDIKSGDFSKDEKLKLLNLLEKNNSNYELIKNAVEESDLCKNDFNEMTNEQFIKHFRNISNYKNLNYYCKLSDLLPYDSTIDFLKKHGERLTSEQGKGYFGSQPEKNQNKSQTVSPLGTGEGVGSYTVSNEYEIFGDFLVHSSHKKWYGTDDSDPNNSSTKSAYVYIGSEKRKISTPFVYHINEKPVYAVLTDDSYVAITLDETEICYACESDNTFIYNYETNEFNMRM